MTKLAPPALLLASLLLALAPSAAALSPHLPPAVCNAIQDGVCEAYLVPNGIHESPNANGGETVTLETCNFQGGCQDDSINVPAVPSTCFAYNPSALTNACVQTTGGSVSAPVGLGPLSSTTVCVVGPVCETVPTPVVTGGPTTVPAPSGYVEPTAVCSSSLCHVSF